MQRIITGFVIMLLLSTAAPAQSVTDARPWWEQQKIRVMWGQWPHARVDKSGDWWIADLPRQLFRNVAEAGGTVFVETRWYKPNHARYAHAFGMKYFATCFVNDLPNISGAYRNWIQQSGEQHWFKCPLDQGSYEKWLVEPYIEGVREGLIDGIQVDWEYYGGMGEATGICYCEDCFATFISRRGLQQAVPEKAGRFVWIERNNLVEAYEQNFHQRRIEMFTDIRKKLHAVNPRLLFSSYGTVYSDFIRATHTAEVPFVFLDARHYGNDDNQPWWESYGSRLKQEGILYIPGGWTNALFGAQPSRVSAARWIYEASINEDGCWLWFERELDDEILRAYATADRQIQAVLGKLGDFLFDGRRDANFVTAVEWTGRPELQQAVITRTYHLGDEHLVHVNNVDTDWPVRVRLRFPRIEDGDRWTVQDGMHDLFYAHDGSPGWSSDDLKAGVVVTLEPRSDLFVRVVPEEGSGGDDSPRLIHSRQFSVLLDHGAASKAAGPIKTMVQLYKMKNAVYGERLTTLIGSTKKVYDLPSTGWRFKMDKQDDGGSEGWFLPGSPLDDWVDINIGAFWGNKGDSGAGWYRGDIDVPVLPEGQRVYLHFGAVDEHLVLWIGGIYAGDYDRAPGEGWDKPFALDVSEILTTGRHHLAMRVNNVSGAGGVWKPVSVRVGAAIGDTAEVVQAETATDGPSGRLVYTATEPMGFHGPEALLTIGNAIRTVDANGAKHLRVRQLRGHLWSPTYSPDGERIAFVHDAGGRGQIFVMNIDGSGAVNISGNHACDRMPRWSPDGKRIAFMSDRTGDWDIYVMNADGSDQRRIAGNVGIDRELTWSPDGKRIVWESHVSGTPNIWITEVAGGSARPLIAPDEPLAIQQGNVGEDKVFNVVEADWPFADNTIYLMDPVWSPDGERIAAVGLGAGSASMAVVLDADGSRMLQVIKWLPSIDNLAWSPNGSYLAGTWRTAPQESERSGVFVIKSDGTDENSSGRWLVDVEPAGPHLGGAQRHGLLTWYSHGSARPDRVMKLFTSIVWSPDGQTLAFSSDMDPSGAFFVYTIAAEGGDEPTRIDVTRSAWPNQIMWQPTQ